MVSRGAWYKYQPLQQFMELMFNQRPKAAPLLAFSLILWYNQLVMQMSMTLGES